MPTENTFNGDESHEPEVPAIIQLPVSRDELPPARPGSAIDEAESMYRAHYEDVVDLTLSMAGLRASLNGSPRWDEAELVFKLKAIAHDNGYSLLAALNTAEFAWACLWAFRRVTGHSLRTIQAQGRRLLIEQRRAITHQEAAE